MELGKLQKKWIESLRKYPQRQIKNKLGHCQNGELNLCCLGQALIEIRIDEGEDIEEIKSKDCEIYDEELKETNGDTNSSSLQFSYNEIGLFDDEGTIFNEGLIYGSLAEMNDSGSDWNEIADFIENNPEKVFKEPK